MANGFRGCWMLALGTNDTANIYAGSPIERMARIERMMSVVGDQPVLWVNVKSLLTSGPYAESNMELWNRTLVQACSRYPKMRVSTGRRQPSTAGSSRTGPTTPRQATPSAPV